MKDEKFMVTAWEGESGIEKEVDISGIIFNDTGQKEVKVVCRSDMMKKISGYENNQDIIEKSRYWPEGEADRVIRNVNNEIRRLCNKHNLLLYT